MKITETDDTSPPTAAIFESVFKSEAQMRLEKSPLFQSILKFVEKLPNETKERLGTPEGAADIQKIFQRNCEAVVDQKAASKKLVCKALGLGKLDAERFCSVIQQLKDAQKKERRPDFALSLSKGFNLLESCLIIATHCTTSI